MLVNGDESPCLSLVIFQGSSAPKKIVRDHFI